MIIGLAVGIFTIIAAITFPHLASASLEKKRQKYIEESERQDALELKNQQALEHSRNLQKLFAEQAAKDHYTLQLREHGPIEIITLEPSVSVQGELSFEAKFIKDTPRRLLSEKEIQEAVQYILEKRMHKDYA